MNKYYYARVSTKDQNEARQLEDVTAYGIPKENVFADKMSGKNFDRIEYQRLLETVQEGDVIYFHSIDRMGRSYDAILKQWRYITETLKVDIVVLDMPLLDTTKGEEDLTGKLIKDIVLQLLSYVAETERKMILQRQREGIEIAKKAGKYKQCDIEKDDFIQVYNDYKAGNITATAGAAKLNISRVTWYAKVKEFDLQ